jgi:phosphopantothenoylcysteine decarboxylase
MANVLLGVTGSVAAIKTPELFETFRAAGHTVRVVATDASLYFFEPVTLGGRDGQRDPGVVTLDADEWPGERYTRGDDVLHIELRRWADLFVVAPLDANTMAKLALGLADSCLTCVWRAWDRTRPRVLAPAMNTLMWEAPVTVRHLRMLADDEGYPRSLSDWEPALEWINSACPRLRIVPPQVKKLACEDVGVGALASVEQIVAVCASLLAPPPTEVSPR